MIGNNGVIIGAWLNAWNSVKTTLGIEFTANRDVSNGYPSLSGFALKLKNTANTFTNTLSNATTAARSWVMPDKDGTVAMTNDLVDASTTVRGLVNTDTQFFSGNKTFTNPVTIKGSTTATSAIAFSVNNSSGTSNNILVRDDNTVSINGLPYSGSATTVNGNFIVRNKNDGGDGFTFISSTNVHIGAMYGYPNAYYALQASSGHRLDLICIDPTKSINFWGKTGGNTCCLSMTSSTGNFIFGAGFTTATAKIEIGSSDGTASSAPLKLRAGTNLTTVENGAIEYDGVELTTTITSTRRTLAVGRETASNIAGRSVTHNAGGATPGATDKNGGTVIITGGISTGTGQSGVQLKGFISGTAGTADNTQITGIEVLGDKLGFYAATPVAKQTIVGDRSDGTALTDLLNKLTTLGIVTNSTTTANSLNLPINVYSGGNLIANGFGETGNNYNFSNLSVDLTNTPPGVPIAFSKISTPTQFVTLTDNFITLFPNERMKISMTMTLGNNVLGQYYDPETYIALILYDGDGLIIGYEHFYKYAGSAETTLAADLNNGDATIQLTSAVGWSNADIFVSRFIRLWPMQPEGIYGYKEATGKIHAPYTYSRLVASNVGNGQADWLAGGISGNTITLNTTRYPGGWNRGTFLAGTKVSNAWVVGNNLYLSYGIHKPVGHSNLSWIVTGTPTIAGDIGVYPGTSKARLGVFMNYGATNITKYQFSSIFARILQ